MIDDDGVSRDTAFQEIRQGAGFETDGFAKRTVWGSAVERLCRIIKIKHDFFG